MKESYQEFFERCCDLRLKSYLQADDSSGREREFPSGFREMLAYFDQSWLDLAAKVLLSASDLALIEQRLSISRHIQAIPTKLPLYLWLHLEEPQPIHGIDPLDQSDPWANERIAAVFFRAACSPKMFQRVLRPSLEWRLDLIDLNGFSGAYRYCYDERSRWRKTEDSVCPYEACREEMDREIGSPTIVPCSLCQEALDYYSRWFAICVRERVGMPLSLKVDWNNRMRSLFLARLW